VYLARLGAFILVAVIHESGHALACKLCGGNVGGLGSWLRGVITHAPVTNCSIKPPPASDWAAGPIMSIAAWFVSALVVGLGVKSASKLSVPFRLVWWWCWVCWSYWFLKVLWHNVVHSYSPPSVWEDTTQFVHSTGINPNNVGLPLLGIFAIALFPALFTERRLFPSIADLVEFCVQLENFVINEFGLS
jgi:hypothetical protein